MVRNTIWNLLGQGAPIVVAVFSIPLLTRSLGIDRFGLLAISWSVIGYFSLFDLGLGRALTRFIAANLAHGEEVLIQEAIWTGLLLLLTLGAIGMAVAWVATPGLLHILKIPNGLQLEALSTFHLLAFSIPLVITSVGLRGVLEAYQRFNVVNRVRIPLGVWTYLAPLLLLTFTTSLSLIVGLLLIGRLAGAGLYLRACLGLLPGLRQVRVRWSIAMPLLNFGGWLTVSNIVNPVMSFLDRFLVGSLISVAAVTFYSVPYEVATKVWVIPVAVTGVLFPAIATVFPDSRDRARVLFGRGLKFLFIGLFPLTAALVGLAHPGLNFWLGPRFAAQSATVLQLLAIGIFINSLSMVAYTLVQSAGRPDLTAKLSLVQLPAYLLIAWPVIGRFGIVGAAALWLVRTSTEAVFLFSVSVRLLRITAVSIARVTAIGVAAFLVLAAGALPTSIGWTAAYLAASLLLLSVVSWAQLLDAGEKGMVRSMGKLRLR